MKYASTVVEAVRVTVRNPFAVVLVSVAASASLLPFVTGVFLAGAPGALAGLWTTSFALGFVAVGGARIATATLEREVSLGTDYFWEGIRRGRRMGLALGVGTFAVLLAALLAAANPFGGLLGLCIALVGVYLVLAWVALATFALALWAPADDPDDVRGPFTGAVTLALEAPAGAGWVLVQAVGWTLVAIPLVIAPVLLLPGFVQLVGIAIARAAAQESPSHSIAPLAEF